MYLRFKTQFINEDDRPNTGIFQAMKFIREHHLTDDEDEALLKELTKWFNDNLEEPNWYSDEKREYGVTAKAVCWFKDSAKVFIQKIHELIVILEKYDLILERVTTQHPGTIVYSDEFQIVAIPFKSERKKVT
jgi:hypothetical protein